MNGLTCLDPFCGCGGFTVGIWESAFHSNFYYREFATMKKPDCRATSHRKGNLTR